MNSEILGLVEKPVRYIGQEWNQIVKPQAPGLTRVAFNEGTLVVNSSQNGGAKDTWIL